MADPHFGKAATFRIGIPVSEHTTEDDCNRLLQMIESTEANKLVFWGFLHARRERQDSSGHYFFNGEMCADVEILLIRGNHDPKSRDPCQELSIKCLPELFKWRNGHVGTIPLKINNFPYLCRSYPPRT